MTDDVNGDAFQRYVDGIPPEFRPLFDRIDRLTRARHPEATVGISYRIPTYRVEKRRLYVGVWHHGLSLYGWKRDRQTTFMSRHPELVTSTGTIRITPADATSLSDEDLGELIGSALDA
jgi:uncharacterized protein YdhG (YjbR/CyaY superfamily)